jgi:hypothetical protein
MRIPQIIILVMAVCVGCVSRSPKPAAISIDKRCVAANPWIRKQLESVSLKESVNEEEANKLANVYWRLFCSNCGIVEPVRDAGEDWKAAVASGFIPTPKGDISIQKNSGKITFSRGPTITNWNEFYTGN